MVDAIPFLPSHVTFVAARAAELERLGEEEQDPVAFVRAARLYTLAVRIADDIDHRAAPPFRPRDLARVRDELRALATDAATGRHAPMTEWSDDATTSHFDITRAFREIALRIEQRVAGNGFVHRYPDLSPGT